MSATNKTQNYELSQFVANDIPGWMSDYNSDMRKIDTAIADVATAQAGGEASVTALAGRVTAVENAQTADASAISGLQNTTAGIASDVTALTSTVSSNTTNISGLTTRVGAVETAESNTAGKVTALETKMGDTSIAGIGDGTVTGAIADLAQGGSGITYSTSEVDTGDVWVDGKHIFRKVFVGSTSLTDGDNYIDQNFTSSYVDSIISIRGTFVDSSDNINPIGYMYADFSNNHNMFVRALVRTGGLDLWVANTTINKHVIIIEYTKATP